MGFNAGEAAGQTVMHLHVHVIPRFTGDVANPLRAAACGRGVIPEKQKWEADPFAGLPAFVHGEEAHLLESLRAALMEAERADLVSAFVQTSGLRVLLGDVKDALARGVRVRLLTGDYLGITSADALRELLGVAIEHAGFEAFLFEVGEGQSFHPKAYLCVKGRHGAAYVGSSNLSASALTHGVEWNLRLVSAGAPFAELQQRFERLPASPRTRRLMRELSFQGLRIVDRNGRVGRDADDGDLAARECVPKPQIAAANTTNVGAAGWWNQRRHVVRSR